jgi:carbon monoxide dehydrogenase subunit G
MNYLKYLGIFMLFIAAGFYGMILLSPSQITFQVNEDIQAPPSQVYDAIANPQRMTHWMHGLEGAKQTKGEQIAVGSEYDLFYPKGMTMHRAITSADTFTKITVDGTVTDFFRRADDYTLEQIDTGTTRVSVQVTMTALGMKSKMIMRAEETHKKNTADNLSKLKAYLEK